MTAPLLDRHYLSRFASETVGFVLLVGGEPTDADSNVVTAQMHDADGTVLFTRTASRLALGQYGVALTGADTQVAGPYDVTFSYTVDAAPDIYVIYLEVGPASPSYDTLTAGFRAVVDGVWVRFSDLFDSPLGGPHLQVYAQSHFGRERMAQLLRVAIGRLNTIAQPRTTYGLDRDFPFESWGALLEQALYVEVVKHLVRSYVEQPDVVMASSVSRLDRRDYMDRWQSLLSTEEQDLDRQMGVFRLEAVGFGGSKVLVSGGAYGRWGPDFIMPGGGQALARGYFPIRRFGG